METLLVILIAAMAADFASWIKRRYDVTPYQLDRWKELLDSLESEQDKAIKTLKKIEGKLDQ